MNTFAIVKPRTFQEASNVVREDRYSLPVIKAGGMDVVDHLKEGLIEPDALIDVRTLGEREAVAFDNASGKFRIDANATLTDIASSDAVKEHAPALAHACDSAATPQVRNVASAAGNLLQRPRCWYYRNAAFDCLKKGGSTCYAVDGENRYHAIFGGGPCHIVHPSNLALALYVLDAEVFVVGDERDRVTIRDLYHLPDKGVTSEHNLRPTEVVTHIECVGAPSSGFCSIKEKQSFDWPLVMAVASVEVQRGRIERASVCAGAVAPVPWPLPEVDRALRGVRISDDDAIAKACAGAANGASPMTQNAYKTRLLPVAVRRAVREAVGRPEETIA